MLLLMGVEAGGRLTVIEVRLISYSSKEVGLELNPVLESFLKF